MKTKNSVAHAQGPNARVSINSTDNSTNIVESTVIIQRLKSSRERVVLPVDVIGGSSEHRRYAAHLLNRYKEFASQQAERVFRYAVIYSAINRKFGTKWDWIPLNRFEDFISFVQTKIDGTKLGRINRSKGLCNYSTFDEFRHKFNPPKQ